MMHGQKNIKLIFLICPLQPNIPRKKKILWYKKYWSGILPPMAPPSYAYGSVYRMPLVIIVQCLSSTFCPHNVLIYFVCITKQTWFSPYTALTDCCL